MDIQILVSFFKWCTILNGGTLILWALFLVFAPDFVYRVQSNWFPISRENYDVIVFLLLGLFKVVFIVFSLVPYVSLLIIGQA